MNSISVHVVHPYISADIATAQKKSYFILSMGLDFHLIDNLSKMSRSPSENVTLMPTRLSPARYRLPCPSSVANCLLRVPLSNSLLAFPYPLPVTPKSRVQNPLSGFAPKQTKESSAWRTSYIVLHTYL